MYLEVTNFGNEKTLLNLEKVILWLYNFTWGFYSQKTEISYFILEKLKHNHSADLQLQYKPFS